jgi:hypothetical protein
MTDSPARTLAKVLETASSEDRQVITAWLLDRRAEPPSSVGTAADMRVWFNSLRGSPEGLSVFDRVERLRGALAPGGESQLVTFRLPQERHTQLRQWCGDHDFSMASVIRGLVERFLEAQPADVEGETPKSDS